MISGQNIRDLAAGFYWHLDKKLTEAQLVGKLLEFARLHEKKIDFGWPEALAVAQATDASVLANRISFAQESVRK